MHRTIWAAIWLLLQATVIVKAYLTIVIFHPAATRSPTFWTLTWTSLPQVLSHSSDFAVMDDTSSVISALWSASCSYKGCVICYSIVIYRFTVYGVGFGDGNCNLWTTYFLGYTVNAVCIMMVNLSPSKCSDFTREVTVIVIAQMATCWHAQ